MSKQESLYGKDNWLHGWTGGDIPFLDMEVLKKTLHEHYHFAKNQAQIYIAKYEYKLYDAKERNQTAHDISLKTLVVVAKKISSGEYEEQGKIEPYIRSIIERQVKDFIRIKVKYSNYDQEAILKQKDVGEETDEPNKSLEELMGECEEEIRASKITHAINNLNLLFKQKFEDKTIEELALTESNTEGGIKSKLRAARKMLHDCIHQKKRVNG